MKQKRILLKVFIVILSTILLAQSANYYEILGIKKDSGPNDIKRAFR